MLIWTTTGPRRAEKPAKTEPADSRFTESTHDPPGTGKSGVDNDGAPGADVILDRPAAGEPTTAVDDGEWSSAETPRTKTPETTE